MKKDKILSIILIFSLISLLIFLYLKNVTPINQIAYKEWYRYNNKSGSYETFFINNDTIILKGNDLYSNCSKYSYNEKTKIIKLNCDQEIKILNFNNNQLNVNINNEELSFFNSIEQSYNYEFNKYFNMSELEFIEKNSHIKQLRKISYEDLINNDSNYIVLLYSNNCINTECIIFDLIFEKWIVKSENVYSFNLNNIKSNQLSYFFKIDNNILNSNYPILLINNNNQIKVEYIKCNGFYCDKYENLIEEII